MRAFSGKLGEHHWSLVDNILDVYARIVRMRSTRKAVVVIQRIAKDNLGDDTGKHWQLNLCQPYFMRIVQRIVNSLVWKIPPRYAVSISNLGDAKAILQYPRAMSSLPGSRYNYRLIDRNDSMRCRWEFNGALFFPRFRYFTIRGKIPFNSSYSKLLGLLCTRNPRVCSISPRLFLISTLISEKLPSRDFWADSTRLPCKSFEITRSQNLIENSVWTFARMHGNFFPRYWKESRQIRDNRNGIRQPSFILVI